jgi:chromosome transmission fidelity protein 8
MQGTINVSPPPSQQNSQSEEPQEGQTLETPIGKLVFPHYSGEEGEGAWQKRVYLFVGPYQRLTGEIKKLPKPVAVIRRREVAGEGEGRKDEAEELEIVEIVKWKIIFSSRPEPVGTQEAVAA